MVKVKTPLSPLEGCIINGIEDVQAKNIKFHNIAFGSDTIEDCEGRVYVRCKKGKWIENDNGTYSCNRCQSWIPKEQQYYANFCLFCGADMRGKQK